MAQHNDVIDPPGTLHVDEPRVILYTAAGEALARRIGFTAGYAITVPSKSVITESPSVPTRDRDAGR